jgi:hypothetical protein
VIPTVPADCSAAQILKNAVARMAKFSGVEAGESPQPRGDGKCRCRIEMPRNTEVRPFHELGHIVNQEHAVSLRIRIRHHQRRRRGVTTGI